MFFLQLRSELAKLFGKKRTYIGFGVFLIAQNVMLLAFRYSNWSKGTAQLLESNGYIATEFISALTVAVLMLIPQIVLLMPLYVTLVGGDLVAKEAEDGTLRMILARPISRFRLLFIKWLTGVIFAAILVIALGGMALLFARFWFEWKGMFIFIPVPGSGTIFNVLSAEEGLKFYALAHGFLAINACTMLSLAFMFSCFNMKPAAATIWTKISANFNRRAISDLSLASAISPPRPDSTIDGRMKTPTASVMSEPAVSARSEEHTSELQSH